MTRSLVVTVAVLLVVVAAAPFAVGSGTAAENVTLTVKTVDSDGDPRGPVTFTASWDDQTVEKTTTQSSGEALLEVPEGAQVTIEITDDRFTRNGPFVIEEATAGDVEVPVSLASQATITVEEDGEPLANANVVLSDGATRIDSGTTGQDGTFTTKTVESDSYTLRVTKPGHYDNTTTIVVTGTTEKTINLESGAVEVQFAVTDDHFDPPEALSDVTIEIPLVGTQLTTLSDGTQSAQLPVNRAYDVTLSKDGYQSETITLEVEEESVELEASINRVPEMTVSKINDRVVVGETSRITVINEYEEPIEGATVTVDGETVGETDADGQFDIPIESAGEATIEVSEDGRSATVTIEGIEPAEETPTETDTETAGQEETPTETAGEGGPGFGIAVTLLAVTVAALLVRRR